MWWETTTQFAVILVFGMLSLALAYIGSLRGAFRSVRREWQEEEIMRTCIAPYLKAVIKPVITVSANIYLLLFATALAGLYHLGFSSIFSDSRYCTAAAALIVCVFANFDASALWARVRGERIFRMVLAYQGYSPGPGQDGGETDPWRVGQYRCPAILEDGRRCGSPCWGPTAYCRWHNAGLTWQILMKTTSPVAGQVGTPEWARYNPEFANRWQASSWATTRIVWLLMLGLIVLQIALWADVFYFRRFLAAEESAKVLNYFGLLSPVWYAMVSSSMVLVWAMWNGNRNTKLPKVLAFLAVSMILLTLFELSLGEPLGPERSIPTKLGSSLGLLLWSVPIATGPVEIMEPDFTNQSRLPPINYGDAFAKRIGVLAAIIGFSVELLAGLAK